MTFVLQGVEGTSLFLVRGRGLVQARAGAKKHLQFFWTSFIESPRAELRILPHPHSPSFYPPLPFCLNWTCGIPSLCDLPSMSEVALKGAIFEEAQFRFIVCQRTVGRKTVVRRGEGQFYEEGNIYSTCYRDQYHKLQSMLSCTCTDRSNYFLDKWI